MHCSGPDRESEEGVEVVGGGGEGVWGWEDGVGRAGVGVGVVVRPSAEEDAVGAGVFAPGCCQKPSEAVMRLEGLEGLGGMGAGLGLVEVVLVVVGLGVGGVCFGGAGVGRRPGPRLRRGCDGCPAGLTLMRSRRLGHDLFQAWCAFLQFGHLGVMSMPCLSLSRHC